MIRKTIILMSFALCVLGDRYHAVSEQHIKINHKEHQGHHGDLAHIGNEKPEHHEEYAWSYPSYEFSYSVHDPHTHDKKGQQESREGDEVKGEYWLIEPDGRKRTVTYNADKHSGFHAIVQYSDHHHHIIESHGHGKDDDEQRSEEGNSGEEGQGEEERPEERKGDDEGSDTEEVSGEKWGYGPKWDDKKWNDKRWDSKKSDNNERDEKNEGRSDEERDREESLLYEERRKFDQRRGYPSNITPFYGNPSRINPRFNMYNQAQRRTANRY